jgi:hypothetical protein
MKQIHVTIDKCGRPKIEAIGFEGSSCTQATKGLVDAFTSTLNPNDVSIEAKPEMHMIESEDQHDHLHN